MKSLESLEKWSDRHHSPWMDALRVVLGLCLLIKGFMFIADTSSLVQLLNDLFGIADGIVWAHAIAILHLVTGFLIVIGLATRISCLIDIPLLLVAIIFVNSNAGITSAGELLFSIIVLLLLILFFFTGSGRGSAYYYLVNSKRSRLTDESDEEYKGASPASPLDKEANIL
ncbi:MAG: DoxX family protein [Chitinophagales bacterium]